MSQSAPSASFKYILFGSTTTIDLYFFSLKFVPALSQYNDPYNVKGGNYTMFTLRFPIYSCNRHEVYRYMDSEEFTLERDVIKTVYFW